MDQRHFCLRSSSPSLQTSKKIGKFYNKDVLVFEAEQAQPWHRNGFRQAGSRLFWRWKKSLVVSWRCFVYKQIIVLFREYMHLSAVLAQAPLQIEIPSGALL